MKGQAAYLLSWTSGHTPARTMYYTKNGTSCAAQEDREKATRFPSRKRAAQRWLDIHAYPEDYEKYLRDGSVRIEELAAEELPLVHPVKNLPRT